jgi:hypothetical protein
MLAVSTDMNIDKDLQRVDVIVERADGHVYNQTVDLYPQAGGLFTPGTFAVVEGDVEAEDVKVSLVARHGSEARVVRELTTKIPRERIGVVQVPVHWLCSGQVSSTGTHSTCYDNSGSGDQTCNLGRCAKSTVTDKDIPDFDALKLYGGYDSSLDAARAGACFDVVRCFDAGQRMQVDLDTCTFQRQAAVKTLNVGLVVSDAGHCNPASGVCYIPVDQSKAYGWTEADGTVTLPGGVCDALRSARVLSVVATGACDTKTIETPTCGPWLGPTGSRDRDNDGIADADDNCPDAPNPDQADSDADKIGDVCDLAVTIRDLDSDGIGDSRDNCPSVANTVQTDTDTDGQGDACDADDDNDGFQDSADPEPLNAFVPDPDADGLPNSADNCPTVANRDQADADKDGQGNACDVDDDNDGIVDKLDNCALMANADQLDCDADGLGNLCDTCDSAIRITAPLSGSVFEGRVFQIAGDVGSMNLTQVAIRTESATSGRVFEQTVPVVNGKFVSKNLILSAGLNHVTATSCNCASAAIDVTANVNPADVLVTLTWDQYNTDMDVYVYEPSAANTTNAVCYFDAACAKGRLSSLGGTLDTDNTTGYGPEHYTLSRAAGATLAPGAYPVRVHYFDGTPPVNYSVRVLLHEHTAAETVDTFKGALTTSSRTNSTTSATGPDWADVAEIECAGDPVWCSVHAGRTREITGPGAGGAAGASSIGIDASTGGALGSGGDPSTGGAPSSGSASATGGTLSMVGTGGAGSFVGTGGTASFGGTVAQGGAPASAGAANVGVSGNLSRAGAANTAGTAGASALAMDSDGDGIANSLDNCPTVANAPQTDTDGDLIGNACECPADYYGYYQFSTNTCVACDGRGRQFDVSAIRFDSTSQTRYDPITNRFTIELDPSVGELTSATLRVDSYEYTGIYGSDPVYTTQVAGKIAKNILTFQLPADIDVYGIGGIELELLTVCEQWVRLSNIAIEVEPPSIAGGNTEEVALLRPAQCYDAAIGGAQSWTGALTHAGRDHDSVMQEASTMGNCALGHSNDVAVLWTAPRTGQYYLRPSLDINANSTLVVLDPTCSTVVSACQSVGDVYLNATAGEQYVIVASQGTPNNGPWATSLSFTIAPNN